MKFPSTRRRRSRSHKQNFLKSARLFRTTGILASGLAFALVAMGCSSSFHQVSERLPASAGDAHTLNDKFERLLDNEDEIIQGVVRGMLAIQQASQTPDGKLHRGTHAKGTCVQGNFEVLDLERAFSDRTLVSRLKKGLFSRPGSYSAVVRFANADGKILDDTKPDVRAISIAVSAPKDISNPQGRMDFAMNNSPGFAIKDSRVFADVMLLAQNKIAINEAKKTGNWEPVFNMLHIPYDPKLLPSVLERVKNVAEAIAVGEIQKRQPLTAYQKMTYWSNVPFQLGEDEAVKYIAVPCSANPSQAIAKEENGLRKELLRHVNSDSEMSCWEFQVQPLDLNMKDFLGRTKSAQDWVENALVEWTSQSYTVAKLTLQPKSALGAEECEARRIDVINNNSEIHRGLGSINRARVAAEAASAARRGAK